MEVRRSDAFKLILGSRSLTKGKSLLVLQYLENLRGDWYRFDLKVSQLATLRNTRMVCQLVLTEVQGTEGLIFS